MARAIELSRGRKTRRSTTHNRDFLPSALGWRLRHNPTFREAPVDNGALNGFDRHRRFVNAEDARAFARSRTNTAGEFGEVVRLVQPVESFLPLVAIDKI